MSKLNLGWNRRNRKTLNNPINLTKMVLRHKLSIIKLQLCFDIEPNQGTDQILDASKKLETIMLNCRSLGKINKLRLILNKAASISRQNPCAIILLQETMVKHVIYEF